MPPQVFIRARQEGDYQWYEPGSASSETSHCGEGPLADLRFQLGQRRAELVLLLEAERVNTRIVPVASRERRHLRRAIPWQLEETLVGDIEQLHFAYGAWRRREGEPDGEVAVAWCDRSWLEQIILEFLEQQLELSHVIPDVLLLPRGQGWALHLDDRLYCHLDAGEGFALGRDLMPAVLAVLHEERGTPVALALSAPGEEQLQQLQQALPEPLRTAAQSRCQSSWELFCSHLPTREQAGNCWEIDLLQGDLARRLPLARWWGQWRAVAALLLVALLAWGTDSLIGGRQQQLQQARMQSQIEQLFRSRIPAGQLVDAEKQLRNRLAQLGGDVRYRGPVSLLARIAPLIAQGEGIELRGLSYNLQQGDIRLNCRAQNFSGIEALRRRMLEAGLLAELVHSSADGDGQQARFLVRWEQA